MSTHDLGVPAQLGFAYACVSSSTALSNVRAPGWRHGQSYASAFLWPVSHFSKQVVLQALPHCPRPVNNPA